MSGIFTTIKVVNGQAWFLEKHAERLRGFRHLEGDRLKRSVSAASVKRHHYVASTLGAQAPLGCHGSNKLDFGGLSKQILRYITHNHITDAALRVDILENGEITYKARELPQDGTLLTAITVTPSEPLPTVKQTDRHIYEKAQVYAEENGADIVIFNASFFLLESTISNIISINKNGNIITPPLVSQGLKGITRQVLLDGKFLKEEEIPFNTLGPIVLINSLRVQGVTHLDGRTLKDPAGLMEKII